MKTWIILSFLLVAAGHKSVDAMSCNFFDDPFFGYTCELVDAFITADNQDVVINTSNHLAGRTDADVRSFTIGASAFTFAFPTGITSQFPNIYFYLDEASYLEELNAGDLGSCANLGIIHIRHSNVARLPNGLFDNCSNLYILDIDHNNIRDIEDDVFANLPNLLELDLSNNLIERIPATWFRNLPNLEDLEIRENRVSEIEDGAFAGLTNLFIFYLRNNLVSEIRPEMFGDEITLVTFNLNNNRLTSVPRLPSRAPRIKYIRLENNLITEINDDDFTFAYSNITNIELTYNQISVLRAAPFEVLNNLDTLIINNNRLTAIDNELFDRIPSLYTFFLEGNLCASARFNNIRSRDQTAVIQRTLDRCYYHFFEPVLSHPCNYIMDGTNYVCELSGVTFLNFRDKFTFGGEHLAGMSDDDVTALRIRDGNFARVPPSIFTLFRNLNSLSIVNSEISVVDANTFEICGTIQHLDLSRNRIRRLLQDSFATCSRVQELILDGNQITEIAPCSSFMLNIYQSTRVSLRNNICVDRDIVSYDGTRLIYDLDERVYRHLNRCFSLFYTFRDLPQGSPEGGPPGPPDGPVDPIRRTCSTCA